ncbi:Os01g0210750 [Oryza sativa Japonica Group]|uniref:Os01g0210750 protein n=1 Tax=Oryza sativa subsp. japonica TaxID=39947 RepID=A0A0P0UZI2_ORYSJ|nr:Os01g0210750 [Oryza sativa Japonica Group]
MILHATLLLVQFCTKKNCIAILILLLAVSMHVCTYRCTFNLQEFSHASLQHSLRFPDMLVISLKIHKQSTYFSLFFCSSYFANPQSRNINIIKIAIGFLEVIGRVRTKFLVRQLP